MPDERSIKALLYGEESSRRVGRPFLRFKGILNDIWWAEQYSRRGEVVADRPGVGEAKVKN